MKKIFILIAAISTFTSLALRADEGMWLLPLIEKYNIEAMKQKGCKLSADDIYNPDKASIKDAIVLFGGGCTGEMISNEGLLITNHHCGYSYIQKLSTPENNYLENGFWALYRDQELPAPGLTVTFLEYMKDVTDQVAGKNFEKVSKQICEQAEKANPHCSARIQPYYNENVYYLIVYKTYRDVRFVGAPPVSLGKFGGETDNWMWPRHTCDFSMFRVYAGQDNEPAAYNPSNKPYTPKRHLDISIKGVNEGDFTFIMGYPGRTQRYQTADQLQVMLERNATAVRARTVRQKIMMKGMEASAATRLKYASKYASSSNGWKKWQGMELAFDKLNIIDKEILKEEQFAEWVNSDPQRQKKYGKALEAISKAVEATRESSVASTLIGNTISTIGPVQNASYFSRYYAVYRSRGYNEVQAIGECLSTIKKGFKDYDVELEKEMAKAMIAFFRDNADKSLYPTSVIKDFAEADLDAYIDNLFATSVFATPEGIDKALQNPSKEVFQDPAMAFYNNILAIHNKLEKPVKANEGKLAEAS
ncbi:MAG: S46 family peptidase, partial [Bacteroidales bacterium]|nr:S46 family peptidase [Bacteroidales bacterium]